MKLTDQFDLSVLTHSDTAARLRIDNTPDDAAKANLRLLYDNVLLPLVKALPGELNITNAFRCNKLNATVKGKPTSQHVKGMAADVEYREHGMENNRKIVEAIKANGIEFDQCIEENGPTGWIHVSYNQGKNRNQFLKMTV